MDETHALEGITWWNDLTEEMRLYWLTVAGSAVPADARAAYLASLSPRLEQE
jgi:hypothetical protein